MLHGSASFCYPHQLYSCLFMFLFRHADVPGKNAHYFRPFVWDCVQAVKMQSKIRWSSLLSILTPMIYFFRSLVTLNTLRVRYPDAQNIILYLPNSGVWNCSLCFKPEAKLMIEKFLSLKKENSTQFIANMREHVKARHRQQVPVSTIISRGALKPQP